LLLLRRGAGIAVFLGVVIGGHGSIPDVEALPCGVVAVGLRVRVRLYSGVEASSPLPC